MTQEHHDGMRIKDVTCFSGKRHSEKDQLKHDYVGDIVMSEIDEDFDLKFDNTIDDSPSDYAEDESWKLYAMSNN